MGSSDAGLDVPPYIWEEHSAPGPSPDACRRPDTRDIIGFAVCDMAPLRASRGVDVGQIENTMDVRGVDAFIKQFATYIFILGVF